MLVSSLTFILPAVLLDTFVRISSFASFYILNLYDYC